MVFEFPLIVNGLSHAAAAGMSLLLGIRLKKENTCSLRKPFYILSGAFICLALLNILWFFDVISITQWDHRIIGPLFNLIFFGIWAYINIFISGHSRVFYIISLCIIGAGIALIVNNLAPLSDILAGISFVAMFFYTGFIDHHLLKWLSFVGVVYGSSLVTLTVVSHILGIPYLFALWFIPTAVVFALLFFMRQKGHICDHTSTHAGQPVPIVIEVFKFGLFIIALNIFLTLGTLAVHELGHSLAASLFSCAHQTDFGVGFAITHVECANTAGATWIALAGFLLTGLVALVMNIAGNDFAKRMSWLLLGFAMITAVDDFSVLGISRAGIILLVLLSSALIAYGTMNIVNSYNITYEKQAVPVCAQGSCDRGSIIRVGGAISRRP